ncbi:MAG: M20/M25/M40 family metallo-hydrolase [Anaerolineae bacterium]|nr:MAG: M20/M25/M40 family metallo-hydrolase [Anaerolineae bacterium]
MDTLSNRILDLAIRIQQVPAPTFHEHERAAFVRARFLEEGLDVETDATGNVYARLPSTAGARPLVVSAHLDTVFPIETDLSISREADRITGPGIGDNALGVAGLFGLLWSLREREVHLPGDLYLVANVGEEGLGNLHGMKAIVERFGADALAYLAIEGMALGQVYHRGLGVRRYRICLRTSGGHSWHDHGSPSAVHELAALVTRLTALPLPSRPRTTLNVGRIAGGTSVNTIAAEAWLEIDLRSESVEALSALTHQVEILAEEIGRPGVKVEIEEIGSRPAGEIPASHPLVRLAQHCLSAQGIPPRLAIGSTDINLPLSRGLPAICLGLTRGGGAHTEHEYILSSPLQQGMEQLVMFVSRVWQVTPP